MGGEISRAAVRLRGRRCRGAGAHAGLALHAARRADAPGAITGLAAAAAFAARPALRPASKQREDVHRATSRRSVIVCLSMIVPETGADVGIMLPAIIRPRRAWQH